MRFRRSSSLHGSSRIRRPSLSEGNCMTKIDALRDEIRKVHKCGSRHVETVPVKQMVRGYTLWQGDVEIFDLIGHLTARRCYALTYQNADKKTHYDTIIES